MKILWLSAVFLPLLASCSDLKENSLTKEAPDSSNGIDRFELTAMPSYDDIAQVKEVFVKNIPWSDTYWPYTEKGMARRWAKLSSDTNIVNIAQYWQDQLDATRDSNVNPLLSPGEKYDLVYRLRFGQKEDVDGLKKEIKNLSSKENDLKRANGRDAQRSAIAGLKNVFASSTLLQNWSPMASQGWNTWLDYSKNPDYKFFDEKDSGDDWSWMGICHGWSPAAFMHDAPKHSVMVNLAGKKVLFSEGDIRGLLSKSWADHSPDDDQYFLGRRCNENVEKAEGEIPHDAKEGRGVTGVLVRNGKDHNFSMIDEFLPGAAFNGRRVYEITLTEKGANHYLVEKVQGNRASYFLSQDLQAVRTFVETGATTALELITSAKFYGCWDVNPASLHTILVEHLGKNGNSFVMDRTRTGQVWNQPVYGARMEVGPLLDAATVDDTQFRHRAPGTTYLAQVKSTVYWTSEPQEPLMVYAADFDRKHLAKSNYEYTLEFDANKQLIGGEWGNFAANKPDAVIPDFLYGFRANSLPVDDLKKGFDYTGIINPIYLCSIANQTLKTIRVNGKDIRYVDCDVAQAN